MQHPRTRAERRYARETWRNHRRKIITLIYTSRRQNDPTKNRGWNKGGKQYTACGNRCGHCIYTRIEQRQQLKQIRRKITLNNIDITIYRTCR
jgi:hypothetical protein